MKETNSSETQLRSWVPRRPSATLKRRIFASHVEPLASGAWLLRLAPAAVCLLAIIASLNQNNNISHATYRGGLLRDRSENNQLAHQVAYLPGLYEQEHNDLSTLTFEWTNHNGYTSSISSFSPGKLN